MYCTQTSGEGEISYDIYGAKGDAFCSEGGCGLILFSFDSIFSGNVNYRNRFP